MIETIVAATMGALLFSLTRHGWQLAFPNRGRSLLVVDPGDGDDGASITIDGAPTELVLALSSALARHLLEHDVGEWPAAVAVEVMRRPE